MMDSPTFGRNFPKLAPCSIQRILNGENVDNVIVQVLGYKRVPGFNFDRFRLLLNDGRTQFAFGVLAKQLNHLIQDKKLEKFTILKLNKYACTEVKAGKKIILCLEIDSLVPGSVVKKQISVSNSIPSATISKPPGDFLLRSPNNTIGLEMGAASMSTYAPNSIYSATKKYDNLVPSATISKPPGDFLLRSPNNTIGLEMGAASMSTYASKSIYSATKKYDNLVPSATISKPPGDHLLRSPNNTIGLEMGAASMMHMSTYASSSIYSATKKLKYDNLVPSATISKPPGDFLLGSPNNTIRLEMGAASMSAYASKSICSATKKYDNLVPSATISKPSGDHLLRSPNNTIGLEMGATSTSTYASNSIYSATKKLKYDPVSTDSVDIQNKTALPYSSTNIVTFKGSELKTATVSQTNVVPILSLTPYLNRWTIKVRIIYKTCIVNYNNLKGSGKFFSFYLLDESGEMKATAFNDQAGSLRNFLKLNAVYCMAGACVKRNDTGGKCDFELTVTESTTIELVEDAKSIPMLKFNFISIPQIKSLLKDSYADVIGVYCSKSEVKHILNKANDKMLHKLEIILIDCEKVPITLSLWGSDALGFNTTVGSVIAVRKAKVIDFAGCALNLSPLSMLFVHPAIPEAFKMRTWFYSLDELSRSQFVKNSYSHQKLLTWKTFNDLPKELNTHTAEYFTIKASISFVQKEKCMYRACPTLGCFKKVTCLENGFYKCDKCNKEYDSFNWTLMLTLNLSDFTGNHEAVAFQDAAESLVGCTADQLRKIKEKDQDAYLNVLSDMHFRSYMFYVRTKWEMFNETMRLNMTVLNANPVEFVPCTKKLVSDIKHFEKLLNMK